MAARTEESIRREISALTAKLHTTPEHADRIADLYSDLDFIRRQDRAIPAKLYRPSHKGFTYNV